MVDLVRSGKEYSSMSLLTPRVGISSGVAAPSAGLVSDNPENAARRSAMTEGMFHTKYGESPGESRGLRAMKYLGAAGVDMGDMVGSLIPGVERGDLWSTMRDAGASGLANFAEQNRSGVEITSGLTMAVLTAGIADMAILPYLGSRLAGSTALQGTKLWGWGSKGIEAAKIRSVDTAMRAALAGDTISVMTSGMRGVLATKVAEGVGRAAFGEAAVALTTHTNKEMWSDDTATNMAWMALGVGLGGVGGVLGARFSARQLANSDEVMKLRGSAGDPYRLMQAREATFPAKDASALAKGAEYKESWLATSMFLQSKTLPPKELPAARQSLLLQEAQIARHQADQSTQKITRRGVTGVQGSGFNFVGTLTSGEAAHLKAARDADPTLLLGVDELGSGSFGRIVDERKKYIQGLRESTEFKDHKLANELEDQEAMGLVGGIWMPDSKELRALSEYQPGKIELIQQFKGIEEYKMNLGNGKVVKFDDNAKIQAQGRKFEDIPLVDQLKIYDGLNKMASRMIKKEQRFTLPENPTWLQMDFALNYAKRGGKVNLDMQKTFKTLEEVEAGSFRAKAAIAAAKSEEGKFGFWERASLNLPLPGSLERIHSGTSKTMTLTLEAALKNDKLTAKELKEIRTKFLQASNLTEGTREKMAEISGGMFDFNRDSKGEWQPVVTSFSSYRRTSPEMLGTWESLVAGSAENKVYRAEKLREGSLTKELVDSLAGSPSFHKSQSILGLADDQITGSGSAIAQGLGTMVTKQMRYRDSEAMLAAASTREAVDRSIDEYTNRLFTDVFAGAQDRLAGVSNRGSKALVDSWFSFAAGWDLKRVPRSMDNGKVFGFQLADTAKNRARLGTEVIEEDDLLMNPNTGKPVVVDQLGLDFITRFQRAAGSLLRDSNAVRASRNQMPLEYKSWYVPPPNTRGKIVGFTIGPDGRTVEGGAIVAKTQEEFDILRARKTAELDAKGDGSRFFSQSELESTADLWDQADMGWVDPGFVGAKSAAQRGSLFGDKVNPRAMEDALEWVADRVRANANGAVRSLYDHQLQIARLKSTAIDAIRGGGNNLPRNIYDEWEATVLGKPLVSVKPGAGTQMVQATERVAQSLINSSWPIVKQLGGTQAAQWVTDLAHMLGLKKIKNFKTFDELASQLGAHSPYASVADFVQANTNISVPPEVGAIAAGINRFSASMLLRWVEFPNAAMNLIGIVTNMPSILRSPNTPTIGTLVSKNGKKVGVVDSYKILAGGFADMLNPTKHADWDFMVKNGDTTQSIAELNKQMSLIESKSSFMRIMAGDKTVKVQARIPRSLKEAKDQIANKGVDGMLSLATDVTESMSRTWAHFIGLRLAEYNGIVGKAARHEFAREVANQAIANYNPLNKPELYQTSLGSMMGLFASYMQQYNQRLFRWAEKGDYLSIGRQMAMQMGFFGTTSVTGFSAVESLFTGMGDQPDATLTDAIYAKFGPKVGSIVAHGGLQEITRIIGLGESTALYTRGDVNFRDPSLDPRRLMAGLNIVSSVAEGMWEIGAKAVNPNDDLTLRYAAEVIARQMPNRAMKGALQSVINGGNEVDATGQIISTSQNWVESGMRLLGLRSGRQQGEVEAYYANTTQRRRLAARMETLREETRSALRSGSGINPTELFQNYVKRGGSPNHFNTWLQDQIEAVSDTRGMRQFVDSLKSPSSQLEAWRYDVRQ